MNSNSKNDVPLSLALACLATVVIGYLFLIHKEANYSVWLVQVEHSFTQNVLFWVLTLLAFTVNTAVSVVYLEKYFNLSKQGNKLKILRGKKIVPSLTQEQILSVLIGGSIYLVARPRITEFTLGFAKFLSDINILVLNELVTVNLSLFVAILFYFGGSVFGYLKELIQNTNKLFMPPVSSECLVLGTSCGEINAANEDTELNEQWVSIPRRGINAGVLITGSVGSGKTQGTILPYLAQLLSHSSSAPMLAIDPKGTFLNVAEQIISTLGQSERVLKISLSGNITFNPVYCEDPLKKSRFVGIAEMVRAAAVNFIGKSSDSPFWDVNSFYLIRNTIIYCASVLGYFTLLDIYKTIVSANTKDLSVDLEEILQVKDFDAEETFNIQTAINYFKFEYMSLEDRVRTGIVTTSTSFINQFQEYAASRVFCPAEDEMSVKSMDDVVKEGKILLFDIQQPGLARSMGTFIKLHYEQAVLNQLDKLKNSTSAVSAILLIDEYQDVVTCGGGGTLGDDSFLAKAREARPAVIVATQSITSLVNTVGNKVPIMELIQNFRTRIACHSSDALTFETFQKLVGKEDMVSETHSFSESSHSAKRNLLSGGFDSDSSNLSESVSQSVRKEDLISGKEFVRLKTFEAFAQVFDGVETRFVKLFLKPYFLKEMNTKHKDVLEMLIEKKKKESIFKKWFSKLRFLRPVGFLLFLSIYAYAKDSIPNACTVAASAGYESCLNLTIGSCSCGFPPRPCARVSYYVPQSFIEVWPDPKASFFSDISGVAAQLSKVSSMPFGAEADDDTQSFHAHAIAVPLTSVLFSLMPAGGARMEKYCFDGMSEHFGSHWNTGKGDMLQPSFLAFSLAPKLCLLKGAATSVGNSKQSSYSSDSAICSFELPKIDMFPPSTHPVCNGWGVFFPRYGTYKGVASVTGALMIASRLKSLSVEVFKSMPSDPDEKWQMIYPQGSSCFSEGQNAAVLESAMNVKEIGRLSGLKPKGFLFTTWKRVTTCRDLDIIPRVRAAATVIPQICKGLE